MIRTTVLLLAFLIQAASPTPARLGDVARQLSAEEVGQISSAAGVMGAEPWLLEAETGQIPGLKILMAYSPPQSTTAELRRGSGMTLVNGSKDALAAVGLQPGAPAGHGGWIMQGTFNWAQVKIPDREFGALEDDQDLNRPFMVRGRFGATELVRIVRHIRTSPRVDGTATEAPAAIVQGGWPVVSVARETETFEIRLRKDRESGQRVKVRLDQERVVVISADMISKAP